MASFLFLTPPSWFENFRLYIYIYISGQIGPKLSLSIKSGEDPYGMPAPHSQIIIAILLTGGGINLYIFSFNGPPFVFMGTIHAIRCLQLQ